MVSITIAKAYFMWLCANNCGQLIIYKFIASFSSDVMNFFSGHLCMKLLQESNFSDSFLDEDCKQSYDG